MPTAPGTLVVRADASTQIGAGHVMRCVALGQAWQDLHGDVLFACHQLPSHMHERLMQEKFGVVEISSPPGSAADADEVVRVLRICEGARIVVDGYHFSADYRRRLQKDGWRVTAIDDFGGLQNADVIVNQNALSPIADYPGWNARVLAGSRFAMLRREFRQQRKADYRGQTHPSRILVSCGGSDPHNVTSKILRLLSETICPAEVVIVAGGSCERTRELQAQCAALPFRARMETNVCNMALLIATCDLAIVAAGSTCWELACLGVPMIAVVTADNQQIVAASVEHFGMGWSLYDLRDLNSGKLTQIFDQIKEDASVLTTAGRSGQALVDGLGASRVARVLAEPVLRLRSATSADAQQLWLWRNQESSRQASFCTDPVPWETHCRWLVSRLSDRNCRLQIAENEQSQPVGQVRVDIEDGCGTISICLGEEFQGQGFGTALIHHATRSCFQEVTIDQIDAFIRADNRASQIAFQKAGYQQQSEKKAMNSGRLHYVAVNPIGRCKAA